jgi:hypothetical protein
MPAPRASRRGDGSPRGFRFRLAEVRGTIGGKREVIVAKRRTNFSFEKRRKEEDRKKKRAEKTQARRERADTGSAAPDEAAPNGTGGENPGDPESGLPT